MTSSGSLILVTGANGFIGTHAVTALLASGYRVRAIVRSKSSAEGIKKTVDKNLNNLSVEVVPDLIAPGALDQVVKGINGALHIASPFTFDVKDNETDMLIPAIRGTERVLEAIYVHAPEAQRVVITSSFAAMADFTKGLWPGHAYNEADWNDVTYDYAKSADVATAYVASKALAEKAAWKFLKDRKPHFQITALCPPMVFGPLAHTPSFTTLNVSAWDMNRFLSGELEEVPDTTFWGFVDVRDLAKAHVRALEVPEAGNERFFIVSGRYSYQKTADVLRASSRIPAEMKKKIPVGKPGQNYPDSNVYQVDNSKSKQVLGLEYRSFEESITDAATKLIELREGTGPGS